MNMAMCLTRWVTPSSKKKNSNNPNNNTDMSDSIFILQVVEEQQGLLRPKCFPFKSLGDARSKYGDLRISFLERAMEANNLWDKVTSVAYGKKRVDDWFAILEEEGLVEECRNTCADWNGSEEDYYFESVDVCDTFYLHLDIDTVIRMNIVIEVVK